MVTLPSAYEIEALAEIARWKTAAPGYARRALAALDWPAEFAARLASRAPGVDWAIAKTVGALSEKLGDLALWSVRTEAILADYRAAGHRLERPDQLFDLDLAAVDARVRGLGLKYQALAVGQGLGAGFLGALAVPADVVALVVLSLRAIGEHAAYHGFDLGREEEKLFATDVLGLAASPTESAKRAALGRLVRLARAAALRGALAGAGAGALGPALKQVAESVGERLVRAKFAEFAPIAGLAVGAAGNLRFSRDVRASARALYRERFLATKYGPELIKELTPRPDDDRAG